MFTQAIDVRVGRYTILAGGVHMDPAKLGRADALISLHEKAPAWPEGKPHIGFTVPDFSAPKLEPWRGWLEGTVLPMLDNGTYCAVHCLGGIGRTGMFIASLVSILEKTVEDPIEETRRRYIRNAVETVKQGELVFALRGELLPDVYETLLWRPA